MTTTHPGLCPVQVSASLVRARARKPSMYDRFSWLYDWVVGSEIYHRVAWGASVAVHDAFAREGLERAQGQSVLDAGCGSLLFTGRAYCERGGALESMTLLDLSPAMLGRAQLRLATSGHAFRFVQGDLLSLPFQDGLFDAVFHFGVLHCMPDARAVLREFARVTAPGGSLILSCLVLGRSRGDRFLGRLHRAGHVAAPRTAEEVCALVRKAGFSIQTRRTSGSFLFLEAEKGAA